MSNVIRLSEAKAKPSHVLIEAGFVPSVQSDAVQVRRYFLSVVEPDGGVTCVWDGPSHKDAMEQARLWELPIVDDAIEGGAA